jgi:hypothetical protein
LFWEIDGKDKLFVGPIFSWFKLSDQQKKKKKKIQPVVCTISLPVLVGFVFLLHFFCMRQTWIYSYLLVFSRFLFSGKWQRWQFHYHIGFVRPWSLELNTTHNPVVQITARFKFLIMNFLGPNVWIKILSYILPKYESVCQL